MTPRAWRWLTGILLTTVLGFVGACFQPPIDPRNCLQAKTCECVQKSDCPADKDCIDGKCQTLSLDAGPGPGELGAPCTSGTECNSGICLPPGPGRTGVCTQACDAQTSCPNSWECKTASGSTNDAGQSQFLCVPPYNALCLPCQQDTDCNAIGDRCLTLATGSFCGRDCSMTGCPSGYACQDLPGADGGAATRQCVPTSNTCDCTDLTVGMGRGCKSTNASGTCYGFELCQADGSWAGCDAPAPAKEVCDGLDNDCDGLFDVNDPSIDTSSLPANPAYPACLNGTSGVCVGTWICSPDDAGVFAWSCGAALPKPELCNGLDEDCNGKPDEPYLNAQGQYQEVHNCGACGYDCEEAVTNLADGGADAGVVTCESRNGAPICVPKKCAQGFMAYPAAAPVMCLKATGASCRSCTVESDCGPFGDKCITLANDQGKWCAQRCDQNAPYAGCTGQTGQQGCCPTGYTCEQNGNDKLCVPLGDSCTCNSSRNGAERSCVKQSSTATCFGQETCGPGAQANDWSWGVCDTGGTTVELCDNADNNCDGVIDEPFINTRDSGTYDTDLHCGSCTNNCVAQWNPAIQHAIGGCDAGPTVAPTCQIVRCTQERVPGGKECQLDSDCTGGGSCHPLYHQCVRSCGSAGDCQGNPCVNGMCTRACQVNADCASLGAQSTCDADAGACSVQYQFVNTDKEPTNGCECPASGAVDSPDLYTSYPDAGFPYVDRDCDGVDGQLTRSIFVRAGSNGNGTRQSPYGSISQAITAFIPGQHAGILVAAGSYVEQVVLKNGVQIFGGYSSDFSRRDVVAFPTLIEGPEPNFSAATWRNGAVNAENITQRTVLAGFTIRGYDVTFRPGPGASGKSSYAVYVRDSSASLVIANNHLVGGRGGDAAQGSPGTAGQNGGVGGDGLNSKECLSASCANESQAGGSAGLNAGCSTASGNPGAGSFGSLSQQPYQPPLQKNGRGGDNGTYQHSDPSQNNLCKYDCVLSANGLNGQPAENGVSSGGRPGGPGCSAATGTVVNGEWVGSGGGAGQDGPAGTGGGGGGAGGAVINQNPPGCTVGNRVGDLGGTGGGGGAGGCGGTAGQGGGGGGGSFALFIVFGAQPASLPTIEGNIIDVGAGGSGGNGGPGGYGGAGGAGGEGGVVALPAWCAGIGGHGGRGGNGGAGSGGGGGCGGSAFAIAGNFLTGNTYSAKNSLQAPSAAAAGSPGAGGASPAGTSSSGASGQPGAVGLVTSF